MVTSQTASALHPQTPSTIPPSIGQNKCYGNILLYGTFMFIVNMTDHDGNYRCLIQKNVPIALILPSRWRDGAGSLGIKHQLFVVMYIIDFTNGQTFKHRCLVEKNVTSTNISPSRWHYLPEGVPRYETTSGLCTNMSAVVRLMLAFWKSSRQ